MTAQHLKSCVRKNVAWVYSFLGAHRGRHLGKVLILVYHRVLAAKDVRARYVQPGMYVLDNIFENHLQYVRENFQVLSLQELLDRWKSRTWDKQRRYCVITFDDGWLDNYLYAYPVLKKYQIPATIFLPTDFIGTHEWFWPEKLSYLLERVLDPVLTPTKKAQCYLLLEQSLGTRQGMAPPFTAYSNGEEHIVDEVIEQCKKLPSETIQKLVDEFVAVLEVQLPEERLLLNWSEVAQMSQEGISFGSHSCSHRILTNLSPSEIEMELKASKRELVAKQVNYVPVFCYPNGTCNQDIQDLVRECGYQAAVGTKMGVEGEFPNNPFEINRIGVHNDITYTIPLFAFRLLGPVY